MSKFANSLTDLIGKTPMLRLGKYTELHRLGVSLVAKLEYFNPAGSVNLKLSVPTQPAYAAVIPYK